MVTGRPSLGDLVADGRLVAQEPDAVALSSILDEAARDIAAAGANAGTFSRWSDAMLYEAGLRSARVIVSAAGYRIVVRDRTHVTAFDAADAVTHGRHRAVFLRFHRMRRRRNEFMYDSGVDPTESDLAQARRDVVVLLELARTALSTLARSS